MSRASPTAATSPAPYPTNLLEPEIFDDIDGDDTQWEREPLERLAKDGELMAYRHYGFWQCMDTLRDRKLLESLWESGAAPWKGWD